MAIIGSSLVANLVFGDRSRFRGMASHGECGFRHSSELTNQPLLMVFCEVPPKLSLQAIIPTVTPLCISRSTGKKKGTARSWMGHPCGQCGVSALCNLSGVLSASSDNPHGFASFYVQRGINLYLGQFFITSRAEPAMKPTAWDWSKGPKAGLPTLGKKR